jgi:hypothetical protein
MNKLIPQIWADAMHRVLISGLEAAQSLNEWMEEYEKIHAKRMVEDPEYAKQHEEFERQWREDMERYAEEYE